MTVKELIEELSQRPMDAIIAKIDGDGDLLYVRKNDGQKVWGDVDDEAISPSNCFIMPEGCGRLIPDGTKVVLI